MSRPPVGAVVFDLGGVLVDWDPRHLYRTLFGGDDAAMEWFLANVCNSEWNAEQDRGRPFAEGVAEATARFPEYRDLIRAYHERWEETLDGPIEATVDLLAELDARGTPLYALTNWSPETWPVARERFGFLRRFDGILVSGHIGIVKPDRAIFALLAERFDLEPARTLLVDDSPENVRAAHELGFRAVRFVSPARLHARLADLGLLDGEGRIPSGRPGR
ncbi:MAG: HAD family phosphatase [Actinomycetota bacterium]|nr:HAD family phosphatase [Actinomycetota bacterium]